MDYYLTGQTVGVFAYRTSEVVNVVLIDTPSLTVGSFAVEGLVDLVLSLSDGLGEELIVNLGTNQSLHFSILKGDITGIL